MEVPLLLCFLEGQREVRSTFWGLGPRVSQCLALISRGQQEPLLGIVTSAHMFSGPAAPIWIGIWAQGRAIMLSQNPPSRCSETPQL